MVIYTVKSGDTLNSVAREYGVSLSYLKKLNSIEDEDNITVGENIVILYPDVTYVTKSGDTLFSIAEQFSVSVNSLLRNNPFLNGLTEIGENTSLVITYKDDKIGKISVNGYIYPFVENSELYKVLPYLTYITLFTYGFNENGELIDSGVSAENGRETELMEIAKEYGVGTIMHLSTLTEEGKFSSELANSVLNNPDASQNLIDNTVRNLISKGYIGLDVDFEYVLPENKDKYSDFIDRMRNAVNSQGLFLITALAPKTSGNQQGLLYEAHDYGKIGANSNFVLLMTYEWGYTYGPPMAVAPINKVREVLEYALTEIPDNKITMGIPNYAYDWKLPYIKGETKARKISNTDAVSLAVKYRTDIEFDSVAQTPYFYYTDENNASHVVWFEDANSSQSKLYLLNEYGLRGIGIWNLMKYFPQFNLVLNSLYEIEKINE